MLEVSHHLTSNYAKEPWFKKNSMVLAQKQTIDHQKEQKIQK
jgi:hypothetical protein